MAWKNIRNVITTLLDNNYPLKIIFDNVRNRIKQLEQNQKATNSHNKTDEEEKNYFSIPYVKNISEKFGHKFKTEFNIAYICNNKLNKYIKAGKDRIDKLEQKDVIYKINCKDCTACSVGQTKRKVQTRITEHKNDIKKTRTINQ